MKYSLYDPQLDVKIELENKRVFLGRSTLDLFLQRAGLNQGIDNTEFKRRFGFNKQDIHERHCAFEVVRDEARVSEISAPTFVNGERVYADNTIGLKNGSIIRLGEWGLQLIEE